MAEIVDFGLQQHKIKMDSRYFENVLSVVAGDTGRRLEVQLLDTNGMVQDTTGLNLRLNAEIAGKGTFTDATLVDAATGKYQLDLSNGMFLAPGNWQFQWQITDSAGKKLHSFAFTGNVGSNISEGGSQATNFYLNLEDLKAMQEDLVNGTIDSSILETNITEKLTNLETQYAPKLTEVTAQLAQTGDNLDNAVEDMFKVSHISPKKVNFIAHRGLSDVGLENSIHAFELAGSNRGSFWGCETDIQETIDGHWICMHDLTIDRTVEGTGAVKDMTLDQLLALNLKGSSQKIPTFEQFLEVCLRRNLVPIIELKSDGNLQYLMDIIRGKGLENKCIIASFSVPLLKEIRTISRSVRIHAFSWDILQSDIDAALEIGNCAVSANYNRITKANVALAHNQGVEVGVYTVDTAATVIKLMEYGVDYITTNKGAARFINKEKVFTFRKTSSGSIGINDGYSSETPTISWDSARNETLVTYDAPFPSMEWKGAIALLNTHVDTKEAGYSFATRTESKDSFYLKCYKNGVVFNPFTSNDVFWTSIVVKTY